MESLVDGVSSLSPIRISRPPHGMKSGHKPNGSIYSSKNSYKTTVDYTPKQIISESDKGKSEFVHPSEVLDPTAMESSLNKSPVENSDKSGSGCIVESLDFGSDDPIKEPVMGSSPDNIGSSSAFESVDFDSDHPPKGPVVGSSPQNSFYSAAQFTAHKESFTNTEVSEKSLESGEVSNSCDYVESQKTSIYRGSTGSDISDESSTSSFSSTVYKPHKANDSRWEAIQVIRSRDGSLGLNHFRLLKQLGCGDIGRVYLSELTGTRSHFAMKVMDKAHLASRKKLLRAQTEREILQSLDHPFLPTLYSHFETEKFSCLVMEFCNGGDLHTLRQRQPGKYFPEHAARFYVAEVLLALEYLHMLGIIYRDLKPENVLVREDGHIMLSDFDLSLRCSVSPTLVRSTNTGLESKNTSYCMQPTCMEPPSCMIQPTCFGPRFFRNPKKDKKDKRPKPKAEPLNQVSPLPELVAEPTSARSMSFVGTHEYLAPEIVKGEGHGSAVDWWTFGIFLYELLFGKTPFKGAGNRATLFNVVGQPLRFPETPSVSFAARDLIRGLLVKEPQHRLAYRRGATEVKQHPFFQSVNWALIRCASPPDVPRPEVYKVPATPSTPAPPGVDDKSTGGYLEIDFF